MGHKTYSPRTFSRMIKSLAGVAALVTAFSSAMAIQTGNASAQTTRFPPEDFGKIVLPHRETTGAAVNYIKNNGNAFEPIAQLREDSAIRKIARAIGRLDMLVEKGDEKFVTNCTAAVVRSDLIITNHHCIPGLEGKVTKALFLLDYLTPSGKGAFHVEVETEALEADATLDVALVKIKDKLPEDIPHLTLVDRRPLIRERLILVHHPAGLVKMMTQFRCLVSQHTPETGPAIRHICDTQPGSSGAILFDEALGAVAIHHSGGLTENDPESFNEGTIMQALLSQTTAQLSRAAADTKPVSASAGTGEQPGQTAPAATKQEDAAGRINKILGQ